MNQGALREKTELQCLVMIICLKFTILILKSQKTAIYYDVINRQ